MLDLLESEGESITILRNVGNCSPNYKESHPSQRSPSLTVIKTSSLTNTIPLSTAPIALREATANFNKPPTNVWHFDLNATNGFGLV